jgi:Matrixin
LLSSRVGEESDVRYEFKFGKVNVFTQQEASESVSSFKIVLTQITVDDLELDYEGTTYGQVQEKFQTQNNTIFMDIPEIRNGYGDSNAKVSFFVILAHELGHSMGLLHAKDEIGSAADPESTWSIKDHPDNLMRSGTLGTELFEEQFEQMVKIVKSQQNEEENE